MEYIRQFIENNGYPPSYQDVADHFRLASKGAVARHIEALEKQRLLSRRSDDGVFRLELSTMSEPGPDMCEIDWMETPGREPADPLCIPLSMLGALKAEKTAAFLVPDDSMNGDHICEGDIAILERRTLARDGEIVVAAEGEERVVIGRFLKSGSDVEFQPSNPKFSIITLPAQRVKVKGVLRGLLRPVA